MSKTSIFFRTVWFSSVRKLAVERKEFQDFWKLPESKLRIILIGMSVLCVAIVPISNSLFLYGLLTEKNAIIFYLLSGSLGAAVFFTLADDFVKKTFPGFKSLAIFRYGFFAFVGYVAYGLAAVEVNAIFGQDASAFPRSTEAAAAMIVATWIYWWFALPVLVASALSSLLNFGRAKRGNAVLSIGIFFGFLLWGSLFVHQAADPGKRKMNIYRIALALDFNGKFQCDGVPKDATGVAFLGVDQRSGIYAPRLVVKPGKGLSFFWDAVIPASFDRVKCS